MKDKKRLWLSAVMIGCAVVFVGCGSGGDQAPDQLASQGEEHPGEEHPGEEHPGEEHASEEHPGEEQAEGSSTKVSFSASDIKQAMRDHIKAKTAEGESGIFEITDKKTGEDLRLKFEKIHDPVRKIKGKAYFACTDFSVAGTPEKLYDLDFWLKPSGTELKVTQTKIHKHPIQKDGEWVKEARFTYKDEEPVVVSEE